MKTTTGNVRLDRALDSFPLDGAVAVLALLARWGKDDGTAELAAKRLAERVDQYTDPDALQELCIGLDDAQLEERVTFWQTLRDAWELSHASA